MYLRMQRLEKKSSLMKVQLRPGQNSIVKKFGIVGQVMLPVLSKRSNWQQIEVSFPACVQLGISQAESSLFLSLPLPQYPTHSIKL